MAAAVRPKHTCSECVSYSEENGYCDEWKIHVDSSEPNCPRFMLATDGGPIVVTRIESVQADECKTSQRTETADASTANVIESLREDLVILGEWAIRLDKRCEQLERRIEQFQDAIIERLAAVGVSIASLQRDVGAVEDEMPSSAIDNLLDVLETQQVIIRTQLRGGR